MGFERGTTGSGQFNPSVRRLSKAGFKPASTIDITPLISYLISKYKTSYSTLSSEAPNAKTLF